MSATATPAPTTPAPATPAAPPTDRASQLAAARAAEFPVPTGREEEWRFTPLEPLRPLLDGAAASGEAPAIEWTADGATVSAVPMSDARIGSVSGPVDRISAVIREQAAEALVVDVAKETTADVTVSVTGRGGVSHQYLFIDVAAYARATVIVDHRGTGVFAGDIEARIGEGAQLTLVSVQDWADGAVHAGHHHAHVGRDARFTAVAVSLGGSLVRLVPTVTYDGPGGDAELWGVYFADGGQHLEHRLFVDHAVPNCRSRVTYKGALQGAEAHTVWVGDVLIRAAAQGTDTYELNRNLVLTDGARADSVPNLEIETGQIAGAGHASATGRFDDEQLFYLQSRGIDSATARRLVVLGFFGEVLERVPGEALRGRLLRAIETELGYHSDEADDAADEEAGA